MKKSLSVLGLLAGICLVTAPANAYVTIFSDNFESGSFNSGWSMNKVVYSSAGLNTGSWEVGTPERYSVPTPLPLAKAVSSRETTKEKSGRIMMVGQVIGQTIT